MAPSEARSRLGVTLALLLVAVLIQTVSGAIWVGPLAAVEVSVGSVIGACLSVWFVTRGVERLLKRPATAPNQGRSLALYLAAMLGVWFFGRFVVGGRLAQFSEIGGFVSKTIWVVMTCFAAVAAAGILFRMIETTTSRGE